MDPQKAKLINEFLFWVVAPVAATGVGWFAWFFYFLRTKKKN